MAATTGFQAAVEADSVQIEFAEEAVWGTAPAIAFQRGRMTSESLQVTKTRNRPSELETSYQAEAARTTEVGAGGQISFAMSYGTYDPFMASLFGADWTTAVSLTGASGDISAVAAGNELTSTTSGKFSGVVVGQWIKLAGFTTAGNNGWARVATKTSDAALVLTGITLTDETPADGAVTVKGRMLRNSNGFKSLFIQKRMGTAGFLQFPGSLVSAGTFSCTQGQFMSGDFTLICKGGTQSSSDASTGTVLAAPDGLVIDTVAGFSDLLIDEATFSGTATTASLSITRDSAAASYRLGSADAEGILRGTFTVSGSLNIYFKDFTLYQMFLNEETHRVSWRVTDADGASYVFTVLNAALMNPQIVAGGKNQWVMAQFTLEGNPDTTLGATLQIDQAE